MAKVSIYNKEGKITGEIELNDAVFGLKSLSTLLHQVYVALTANARQPWAHTKNKGEVAGGGRKPWKQKGTGRARHGSIRSPIWKGGGVTFGPLNVRNYKQKINRKMNQKAVRMSLSDKVRNEKIIVMDSLDESGKTNVMAALRVVLPSAHRSTLLVLPEKNEMQLRATRNLPKFDVTRAMDVNLVDLMHHQYIITTKEALDVLESRLA